MLAGMSTLKERALEVTGAVEAELRRLGLWAGSPPHPEDLVDPGPFGLKTLSPEQWLQFVLLPRVQQVVNEGGEFPTRSSVSVWAARNFDGDPDAGRLLALLREFDALFNLPAAPSPGADPTCAGLIERLVRLLATLPTVKEAWLAQLLFPATSQLTSPVLGLSLDGALAADAFAQLGADPALVVMVVGDDAISRLLRLGAPIYARAPRDR